MLDVIDNDTSIPDLLKNKQGSSKLSLSNPHKGHENPTLECRRYGSAFNIIPLPPIDPKA